MSDEPAQKGGRKATAGVAGAGGGTLLTAFVQLLLDDKNPWKKFLLLAIPTVSVGISVCWFYCIDRIKEWLDDLARQRRIKRVRALADQQLAKDLPQDEKAKVLKKVQDFEFSELDNVITEVKSLHVSQKARLHTDEKMA